MLTRALEPAEQRGPAYTGHTSSGATPARHELQLRELKIELHEDYFGKKILHFRWAGSAARRLVQP